ncbi:UNVERIFIED_CONTAM: hypothetical protein Sangu_2653800 [Sesamum angustifolium]|uniref:Uncharacterized protein n=1 Tax=Sesamum angustifolium TaxID=2727405 RepID=A0AAW2J243_9LAMI
MMTSECPNGVGTKNAEIQANQLRLDTWALLRAPKSSSSRRMFDIMAMRALWKLEHTGSSRLCEKHFVLIWISEICGGRISPHFMEGLKP